MQGIEVHAVETDQGLIDLEDDWNDLFGQAHEQPYALTWEYNYLRWKYFSSHRDLWILVARDDDGKLAGIAPWTIARGSIGPFSLRILEFLCRAANPATIEPYDGENLSIIAPPEYRERAAAAFVQHLQRNRSRWDVVDLAWLSPESVLRAQIKQSTRISLELQAQCFISSLPDDLATYEARTLGNSKAKRIRRYGRWLERDYPGQVCFHRVSERSQVEPAILTLIEMNEHRWSGVGQSTAFQDPQHMNFHVELAQMAIDRGRLRLHQLRVGDDVLASNCCIAVNGTYHVFHKGFNPDWKKYSPGNVLQHHEIGEAIAEGCHLYDLGHGAEEAKIQWTDRRRNDVRLLAARSWRGLLYIGKAAAIARSRSIARRLLSGPTYMNLRQLLLDRVR